MHSAYDGLHHVAGLWTRLNPDESYVSWASEGEVKSYTERDADTEPEDWSDAGETWGHASFSGANDRMGWAGVAEMADRTELNRWTADLEDVLAKGYPAPKLPRPRPR